MIPLLNVGTDATHAEHIETIKNRCYVGVQQDGTFLPGQLGMGLVEGKSYARTHQAVSPLMSNFGCVFSSLFWKRL